MRPLGLVISLGLLVPLATFAACSRDAPAPPQGSTEARRPTGEAPSTAPSSEARKGTLALGERITAGIVPLAAIAGDARHYEDRVVATAGTVTAVCQEMGCWMEIRDDEARAHIRMHGHTFFVPKTASGHVARVQAKVVRMAKGGDDCEPANGGGGKTARVELDATGVEID